MCLWHMIVVPYFLIVTYLPNFIFFTFTKLVLNFHDTVPLRSQSYLFSVVDGMSAMFLVDAFFEWLGVVVLCRGAIEYQV